MTENKPKSAAIFNQSEIISVNKAQVEELKRKSLEVNPKVFRLCLHSGPQSKLHEMIIVHQRDAYVKPHKHVAKSESFHVVEGELDVFIFDDHGKVTERIEMGDYRSGKAFCYRLSAARFHTVLPRSSQVVFHEVTDGPFIREETIFSDWSPALEASQEEIECFIATLKSWRQN